HADRPDAPGHVVVLALADRVDGLGIRRIAGAAFRCVDAARGEEVAHAVEARLAVDVVLVVGLGERRLPMRTEHRVERRRPSGAVHGGGVGQDTVQIKEAGAYDVRQSQHSADASRWRKPRIRCPAEAGRMDSLRRTSGEWYGYLGWFAPL